MKKVLFLDSLHPYLQEELEKKGFACIFDFESSIETIAATIGQYDGIIIRSRFKLQKEILDKATNLKFIARGGAGLENIDVAYAEGKGIKCLHAPEGNRDAVGEHAVGMILSLFNNLIRADRQVREGTWIREGNRGLELMGKTIGIIGYGNMGGAFAKRLKGFDVKVLAFDKYKIDYSDEFATEASYKQIFEEADILSLHLPLTEETKYLVNDEYLNNFRKSIWLINTARGPIVKTDDLVKNLKSGKVAGACLDVLEYEAVSFENLDKNQLPEAFQYLTQSNKVQLSPHIGGWTQESNYKIARTIFVKICQLYNLEH
ncbi:MAG: hydroxyacid dehydrogenase [Bacteroidetes bacterium]|nr:hydroxyacid dehydrogenase [Bacteroidota bacterium]